ncbi:MAG: alpha-hydroxy-acid oxidizing protein [Treponema sp.]|nr:alpha-hydroxy-acid oxidizing protein [Treponema sp.]
MADSNEITRKYFESLLLEMRHIGSVKADTKITLFGQEFETPVATAALSHMNNQCENGMAKMALGAKMAGALCFSGMGEKQEIVDMCATGAKVIKIIKPHEKNETVLQEIRDAEDAGAFGVGMDIDHAFRADGEYDVVCGLPMKSKSFDEMKSFVQSTKLPFVVKGVLSVQDAKLAVEMGAAGIIVSHHHGIMGSCVPPLMILPEIVEAVGGKLTIFVDCCIESGMDAFKALAVGADAVCVGRAIMPPLKEKGENGVAEKMTSITNELKGVMSRTGFSKLEEINDSVIWSS